MANDGSLNDGIFGNKDFMIDTMKIS